MKIKEDITKQGVPNYNAQTSKDAFKFHKNPVNKVPIKRTAMRKEVVGDFDSNAFEDTTNDQRYLAPHSVGSDLWSITYLCLQDTQGFLLL